MILYFSIIQLLSMDILRSFTSHGKDHSKVVEVLGPSLYRMADGDNPRKQKVVHFNRLKPAPAKATPSPEVVVLVPGQLAEPEEGLPDEPREPDGLEGDPPIQDPPNLAARDCNRDIPPPLAQVEPEDIACRYTTYHLGKTLCQT